MSPNNNDAKRKIFDVMRDSIISPGKTREDFNLMSPRRTRGEFNLYKQPENPEVVK
jgi:hypothetical protein